MKHQTINISVIFFLALLTGCSASPPRPGLDLQGDHSLHVEVPTIERVDMALMDPASAVVGGTALSMAGAAGGVALGGAGGLVLGATCGPAWIICGPLYAVAGAGMLGVGGGAAGAKYGGKGFTSGDKGARFNAHVEASYDEKTVSWKLYDLLVQAAERRWQLDPVSENSVTVQITRFGTEQLTEQRVRIVVEGQMQAQIDGTTRLFRLRHVGPDMHIDSWLAHEGRMIDTAVNDALEDLSLEVMATLARPPAAG